MCPLGTLGIHLSVFPPRPSQVCTWPWTDKPLRFLKSLLVSPPFIAAFILCHPSIELPGTCLHCVGCIPLGGIQCVALSSVFLVQIWSDSSGEHSRKFLFWLCHLCSGLSWLSAWSPPFLGSLTLSWNSSKKRKVPSLMLGYRGRAYREQAESMLVAFPLFTSLHNDEINGK